MSFERPSLQDITDKITSTVRSNLGITTILRRSFIYSIIVSIAGIFHQIIGYIQFLSRQIFPDTAEREYLERFCSVWGVKRNPARYSIIQLQFSGVAGSGVSIGTLVQSSSEVQFVVNSSAVISVDSLTVQATALIPGAASNPMIGDTFYLVSPISGIKSSAIVTAINQEGEDEESDESLREKLIDRIQNVPCGGNANDYIRKSKEVTGVTRSWCFPNYLGPGTVGVMFVEDGEPGIVPSAAKITEVRNSISSWLPVTVINLAVQAPNVIPLNMTIAIKPNTLEVQNAISEEIRDLIARESQVKGAYSGPNTVYDGSIALSRINEAISLAMNEEDHQIILINDVAPSNVAPANAGDLIVPGIITWQTLT